MSFYSVFSFLLTVIIKVDTGVILCNVSFISPHVAGSTELDFTMIIDVDCSKKQEVETTIPPMVSFPFFNWLTSCL